MLERRSRAERLSHAAGRRPRLCVILPVHWSALMGGSQYQAKLLIERLLERYDVDIHYLTVQCDPDHRPVGYALHRFSSPGGLRRYGYFFDAWRLYHMLVRLRPDVVYQQVGCAHTGIAAWYARRNGALMVWRVSSDSSVKPERISWRHPHRRLERIFLEHGIRKAHVILAQTAAQRSALAKHYGRGDAEVVPNFHAGRAPPPAARRRDSVVWIANLKPLKNPHAFVRLAASFAGASPVRFVMIGAAMLNDRWTRDLLRAIQTVPNLDYLGARTLEEVNAALSGARVFVNTSDYEELSNTFMHAWMLQAPVVSQHADHVGSLGRRGLDFVSGTEEQLRRDVRRLVDDEPLAREIGVRCRDYALRNHSIENVDRIAALLGLPRRSCARAGLDAQRDRESHARGAPRPKDFAHASDAPFRQ